MIVRDVRSACGCIRREITYTTRITTRSCGVFIMPIAVCLAQHLRQHQGKESYFGKMYGQRSDRVTAIASRLFTEKLELETTN